MSKLNIEIENILPIDLIQVMPKSVLGTETVPKLQLMQHTAWSTSPLFLKNPLTVARIIEALNRSGLTPHYSGLTAVGVKTNDGEGIVFSSTGTPIQQTMQYPKHENGSTDYSGVQFPETKCVWDIIAQCMAENEPLLGAKFANDSENNLEINLEHFATQGVTIFKTIVDCSDTNNGTVRGLIIESGIVCTNNLENANQIAVSIDSKVLVNTDDIMNPFTFKLSEQFVGLDKENVTEVE